MTEGQRRTVLDHFDREARPEQIITRSRYNFMPRKVLTFAEEEEFVERALALQFHLTATIP